MTPETKQKIRISKIGEKNPQWKGGRPKCEICGKLLTDYRSKICNKHRNPMSEITKEKLSKGRMGNKNPMYGKKLSEEHKKKLSLANKDRCGKKNPNWKGTTPLNKAIRELPKMRDLKISVFKRDDRTCQCCGSKKNIQAHHILSISEIIYREGLKNIDDALKCKCLFDKTNIITLCEKCHKLTLNYGNSSYKYFVDKRGVIKDLVVGENFNSLVDITFEKGAIRGNHVHRKSKQADIVLDGILLVASGEKKYLVSKGEKIIHEPNIPHAYKAITTARLLSIISGIRQGSNYSKDTYALQTPLIEPSK